MTLKKLLFRNTILMKDFSIVKIKNQALFSKIVLKLFENLFENLFNNMPLPECLEFGCLCEMILFLSNVTTQISYDKNKNTTYRYRFRNRKCMEIKQNPKKLSPNWPRLIWKKWSFSKKKRRHKLFGNACQSCYNTTLVWLLSQLMVKSLSFRSSRKWKTITWVRLLLKSMMIDWKQTPLTQNSFNIVLLIF